jgi:hypothetical protein
MSVKKRYHYRSMFCWDYFFNIIITKFLEDDEP